MALFTTVALATALAAKPAPAVSPIAYQTFAHGKHRYHMVTVDLNSGSVSAGTTMTSGLTPVWSFIRREYPVAAITGTFFAPKQGIPVADVLVNGDLKAKGDRGSAVGVTYQGLVDIFDQRFKKPVDWTPYRHGVRGAVRLITNGVVHPNPKAQRFRDRAIWGKAARTAVGLTKSRKLVLFATSHKVTLSQLGKAMRSRGVMDAVSLDGGSSACLYYNGVMKVAPKRKLVNMLLVYNRPPSDALSATAGKTGPVTIATQRPAPVAALPPAGAAPPDSGPGSPNR